MSALVKKRNQARLDLLCTMLSSREYGVACSCTALLMILVNSVKRIAHCYIYCTCSSNSSEPSCSAIHHTLNVHACSNNFLKLADESVVKVMQYNSIMILLLHICGISDSESAASPFFAIN